jgi:hypothetical protein
LQASAWTKHECAAKGLRQVVARGWLPRLRPALNVVVGDEATGSAGGKLSA